MKYNYLSVPRVQGFFRLTVGQVVAWISLEAANLSVPIIVWLSGFIGVFLSKRWYDLSRDQVISRINEQYYRSPFPGCTYSIFVLGPLLPFTNRV